MLGAGSLCPLRDWGPTLHSASGPPGAPLALTLPSSVFLSCVSHRPGLALTHQPGSQLPAQALCCWPQPPVVLVVPLPFSQDPLCTTNTPQAAPPCAFALVCCS